jgi:hypothetical protein
MSEIELTKWIIVSALGLVVWFMKRTIDSQEERIRTLEKNHQNFREDYLHKNDFKDFKIELRSMFEEIKTDIRELKK